MGRKVFVNRPTGSGAQLVVSNIRLFSRVHSPRARCEESVLSGYIKGSAKFYIIMYRTNGGITHDTTRPMPCRTLDRLHAYKN